MRTANGWRIQPEAVPPCLVLTRGVPGAPRGSQRGREGAGDDGVGHAERLRKEGAVVLAPELPGLCQLEVLNTGERGDSCPVVLRRFCS